MQAYMLHSTFHYDACRCASNMNIILRLELCHWFSCYKHLVVTDCFSLIFQLLYCSLHQSTQIDDDTEHRCCMIDCRVVFMQHTSIEM